MSLDATYVKAWVDLKAVSHAVVIATGVTAGAGCEHFGVGVGDSEDVASRRRHHRAANRALGSVSLEISDAHRAFRHPSAGPKGRAGSAAGVT